MQKVLLILFIHYLMMAQIYLHLEWCTYSMKTIVLGPPGTGKTETLLEEVDKYLKITDPNRIGYFSFTQKAAYEGRDRAIE